MQLVALFMFFLFLTGCGMQQGIQRSYFLSQAPLQEIPIDIEEWPQFEDNMDYLLEE